MPTRPRRIHLSLQAAAPGHPASWRVPEGRRVPGDDVAHFQEIAQLGERALLNAIFLADNAALDEGGKGPSRAIDPIVLVAAMAAATEKIGLVATLSTTFNHPYTIARQLASLDHLSRGRTGWNIVTTTDERAARNFGADPLPPNHVRYARAAEFTDVVLKLWESWEEGACLGDARTGQWADPERIHPIRHVGTHFFVEGALTTPRPPQGRPLLVQAGSSTFGRDFAARYADAVFTVQNLRHEAVVFYSDLKRRAADYGRDPAQLSVLPGLSLVIGSTEAEAKARLAALDEIANDAASLQQFAQRIGVDPAALDFDKPFPRELISQIKPMRGYGSSTGHTEARLKLLSDPTLTVREIIQRGGGGHNRLVGSPEQIADFMESWFNEGAADGFNLFFDIVPTGLKALAEHVVPILQRRGLYPGDYEGTTLREYYGLSPVAASGFSQTATAPEVAATL